VGERYIQVWAPDNGRVPFPGIITIGGGRTLWAINWRWGNGVPLRPITLYPLSEPTRTVYTYASYAVRLCQPICSCEIFYYCSIVTFRLIGFFVLTLL